jgi:hypothetical protein
MTAAAHWQRIDKKKQMMYLMILRAKTGKRWENG